jgi:hypothetical protein
MRRFLLIAVLIAAAGLDVFGATLAGVTMPDSVSVSGRTLVLNGMGLRTRFLFRVYVGGLYLDQKSADATAILERDAPMRIVMHFLRGVSKDQIVEASAEALEDNAPDALETHKVEFDRLLAALDSVEEGGVLTFTYVPGTGTTFTIGNTDMLTIPGHPFARALFSSWLGPRPPSASLKRGLLGQR